MNRRRRLGQHYLVDAGVVRDVIGQASRDRRQRIVEIGTGRGILTSELARLDCDLEAYEIDPANLELTRAAVGTAPVSLRLGDAFEDQELSFDVLVSSLPYSESSRFVEWLSRKSYRRAVVILQEDFVEKMLALPGQRNYRAISVIAQCSFRTEVVRRIGRSSFRPRPRVDSELVVITPLSKLDAAFNGFIRRLFSLKKRKVGVALKVLGLPPSRYTAGLEEKRVYQLDPERLRRIAEDVMRDSAMSDLRDMGE